MIEIPETKWVELFAEVDKEDAAILAEFSVTEHELRQFNCNYYCIQCLCEMGYDYRTELSKWITAGKPAFFWERCAEETY
jgi:hypothetical protein